MTTPHGKLVRDRIPEIITNEVEPAAERKRALHVVPWPPGQVCPG